MNDNIAAKRRFSWRDTRVENTHFGYDEAATRSTHAAVGELRLRGFRLIHALGRPKGALLRRDQCLCRLQI